jgi:hypothetical protein
MERRGGKEEKKRVREECESGPANLATSAATPCRIRIFDGGHTLYVGNKSRVKREEGEGRGVGKREGEER